MSSWAEMRQSERIAVEAVASHFSTACQPGDGVAAAYLTIAGERVALAVAAMGSENAARGAPARPRLRFDKVALRFVKSLQAALRQTIPDGGTVILTVTASIRLPAKTATALEDEVRALLAGGLGRADFRDTINDNRIRVRLVSGGAPGTSDVIGFVHNPDCDPDVLVAVARSLLECIATNARKRLPASFAGVRWLVIANEGGIPFVETYRQVCSQLSAPTGFKKIVMVLAGGRVEPLTG
jgi:hypothetical protein